MRIIAGHYKGKRLNAPKDNKVRPTTDKVKEALFSMADSYADIEDGIVADLFAGTGNLGIEAISRGSKLVFFGDINGESIKLIKENLEICKGASEKAKVYHGDYKRTLEKIKNESLKCDLFFVDPPYFVEIQEEVVEKISELALLSDDGVIFVEHSKNLIMSEKIGDYTKFKEKKYGIINISVYSK